MTQVTARAPRGKNGVPRTTEVIGSASFSDLVRAHFEREQERASGKAEQNGAEVVFTEKLRRFEEEEGRLAAVCGPRGHPSPVPPRVGAPRHARNPIAETDAEVRLHRVTDWVTKSAEPIAELLHECDVLAIRVREVLR